MKEKTGEEVIIRKHKKGWMIASLCGCVLVFALAGMLLMLPGGGDDPFDLFYAIAIAAIGFGGGVYFCRKIVCHSRTPRALAVFADGQLRVFAGGGWNAFRTREIQFVEENPLQANTAPTTTARSTSACATGASCTSIWPTPLRKPKSGCSS